MSFEDLLELAEPLGVGGPSGAGDEFAVGDGAGDVECNELAACELDVGRAGWVGVDALALDDTRGGEYLRAVAEAAMGLPALSK
jgi:hypothetical protein